MSLRPQTSTQLDEMFEHFDMLCEYLERAQDPDADRELRREAREWAQRFLDQAEQVRKTATAEEIGEVLKRLRYDAVYVERELQNVPTR